MRLALTVGFFALSGCLLSASAYSQAVPASPDPASPNKDLSHQEKAPLPSVPFGAESKLTDHTTFNKIADAAKPETHSPEERCGINKREEDAGVQSGLAIDFKPYVGQLQRITNANWKPLIPKEADAPVHKKGVVEVCFTLLPSGQVEPQSMVLIGRSGDEALDRAAWGAIQNSVYPPLPAGYQSPDAVILFHFAYNTDNQPDPLHHLPKPRQLPGLGTFTVGYTSKL